MMDLAAPVRMMDRHRRMINGRDTVTLCIGGQIFVTRRSTLFRLPNSRLYMMATQEEEELAGVSENEAAAGATPGADNSAASAPSVYYYDRDPEIFRFVLDYYRTGELHLPASICGPFVRKELIFWGIDESYILPCCMPAYMRYEEERRTKETLFKDCFEDIDSMQNLVQCCRGFKRWRYTMWLFLDYPSSSLPAKIWATILLLLMIGSVLCFCLSTHEAFRIPSAKVVPNNSSRFCKPADVNRNPKIKRDCTTEPRKELVYTDVTLNLLFTLEFLSKLILAPDKKKFLKTFISILDIVILSSYWTYISLYYYYYYHFEASELAESSLPLWTLNNLSMTQALRILRIFKISKISRGLRVLMLTIKKSITELVLLGFLLMNGIFCFSSLIYMAEYQQSESYPNIPESFWWAIITLTAVGYGDTYPRGGFGYLVGSIAAISGCIVTGLAIPIIGNNFNTYYKYMQNQLERDKYIAELRKEMDQSGVFPTDTTGPSTGRKNWKLRAKLKVEGRTVALGSGDGPSGIPKSALNTARRPSPYLLTPKNSIPKRNSGGENSPALSTKPTSLQLPTSPTKMTNLESEGTLMTPSNSAQCNNIKLLTIPGTNQPSYVGDDPPPHPPPPPPGDNGEVMNTIMPVPLPKYGPGAYENVLSTSPDEEVAESNLTLGHPPVTVPLLVDDYADMDGEEDTAEFDNRGSTSEINEGPEIVTMPNTPLIGTPTRKGDYV